MDARFDTLMAALSRAGNPAPVDHASALQGLPEPETLPSPWETWTLIGLLRHRGRQIWVANIVRNRLRGAPSDLAAVGALGHPEGVKQLGPVPGLPEWEYYFHGRGCRLTHKVDGTEIDVDFFDDSADYFDTFFYKNYLESLRNPEPPEQCLRELHPSARAIALAVEDLLKAGALIPLEGRDSHPYRVSDRVLDAVEAINVFCAAWASTERRLWLAALIGDWPAANEAAARLPELAAITAPRSARCFDLWWNRLRRDLDVPSKGGDALQALADLKSPDIDSRLEHALSGPPSGTISAALAVIGQVDDPKWCPRLFDLFSRVNPGVDLPQPHIWITSMKFLLRHGYSKDYRTKPIVSAILTVPRQEPAMELKDLARRLPDDIWVIFEPLLPAKVWV
ncbi:MAG: hypothetical protein J0I06_19300, partial [Planctomycetes bacterium]|nr:hypothetical protein [Planctomycetota bacterium]